MRLTVDQAVEIARKFATQTAGHMLAVLESFEVDEQNHLWIIILNVTYFGKDFRRAVVDDKTGNVVKFEKFGSS